MHPSVEPVDCGTVRELLEPFVDGELHAALADAVEEHLASCPGCSRESALALAVREGLRSLPGWDPPGRVTESVRQATVRSARRGPASGRRPAWAARLAAAAAAVLTAAVAALWWYHAGRPTEPTPTVAEVTAASAEARYALALVARVTRRAGVDAGQRALVAHVLRPTVELFTAAPDQPEAVSSSDQTGSTTPPGGPS